MKKCKNITFCHVFAFGGPCDVQKWVKVYKVYVSWKPWLYSLRRHQKKWFLSDWERTRCNRSAQGLKMANCTSFKILTRHGLLQFREIEINSGKFQSSFREIFDFWVVDTVYTYVRTYMYGTYMSWWASWAWRDVTRLALATENERERSWNSDLILPTFLQLTSLQ